MQPINFARSRSLPRRPDLSSTNSSALCVSAAHLISRATSHHSPLACSSQNTLVTAVIFFPCLEMQNYFRATPIEWCGPIDHSKECLTFIELEHPP